MTGKRVLYSVMFSAVVLLAFYAVCSADTTGRMDVKSGDEIYVCACGEMCDCDTMSMKPGQCSCGKDMIKTKVTKVDENMTTSNRRRRDSRGSGNMPAPAGRDVIATPSVRNRARVHAVSP